MCKTPLPFPLALCKSTASFLIEASRLGKTTERVECCVAQRAYILTVQFQTDFFYRFR